VDGDFVSFTGVVPQGDIERADTHVVVLPERAFDLRPVPFPFQGVPTHEIVGDRVDLGGAGRVAPDVLAGQAVACVNPDREQPSLLRTTGVVDDIEPAGWCADVVEVVGELDRLDPRDFGCHVDGESA